MDIEQIRTFLAIVEGKNFVSAARRLNLTQSTVSARVKALEGILGRRLFVRSKSGCAMTPAGHQFYRYARSLLRVWQEAKHQVAVPDGFQDTLMVGGQYSLWNRLLLWWVPTLREAAPRVALRCEVGMPRRLMREMAEGVLDLAVIYRPEHRPGLVVEELLEDRLVLVTTDLSIPFAEKYVFAEWGESFRDAHAADFPDLHNPGLTLDLGALGINYLLNQGGAAYFPERVAAPYVDRGGLFRVPGAPEYPYPAYVVYQEEFASPRIMTIALSTLRETARASLAGELPPGRSYDLVPEAGCSKAGDFVKPVPLPLPASK